MKTDKLIAMAALFVAAGWPAGVYNSGGNVMVVAVYPPEKKDTFETSKGQYEYCAFLGCDDGPWGMDIFDRNGDYIEWSGKNLDQKNVVNSAIAKIKKALSL